MAGNNNNAWQWPTHESIWQERQLFERWIAKETMRKFVLGISVYAKMDWKEHGLVWLAYDHNPEQRYAEDLAEDPTRTVPIEEYYDHAVELTVKDGQVTRVPHRREPHLPYREIPDTPMRGLGCTNFGFLKNYLYSCPFCGKKATPSDGDTLYPGSALYPSNKALKRYERQTYWQVHCPESSGGCGAEGGYGDSPEEAIFRWNMRLYNKGINLEIERWMEKHIYPYVNAYRD